jgi:glycosidase
MRSSSRRAGKVYRGIVCGSLCVAGVLFTASGVRAEGEGAWIQLFELSWANMERRTADIFVAGYDGIWLPPPWKASSLAAVGYDCFDRFDLGSPTSQTAYGTDGGFRAVVDELHNADVLVYIDTIMNHNSGRTSDGGFIAAGGWPGLWEESAAPGAWGDYHDGTTQSHDPGGANYNLFEGDLVSLVDIAQESNNLFFRHPVDPLEPLNIPLELADPGNSRFYPDQSLTPKIFNNPETGTLWTVYPFNNVDSGQGDPVLENATAMLMRSSQMMLDVYGVDGFRLDAAKHIPSWFWDEFWDVSVYDRRTKPDGTTETAFSFVESVESNFFTYSNYVRKDGFGNRDALDLNGAGQARDLVSARGFGSWLNILQGHIDNEDDGFNNGTVGVNHLYSHDNGSYGDGGSAPSLPDDDKVGLHAWAYLLMRPGHAVVYHNAREMHARFGQVNRFWPREGNPTALGLAKDQSNLDPHLTTLVQLRNRYGRGELDALSFAFDDVLMIQRRTPLGGGQYVANCMIGTNDRYDSGFDQRTVTTDFPVGMRLHELTGNAADPVVDPFGDISEVLTVGAGGVVTVRIPRNTADGVEHHRGYVVYGPATPSGTLVINGAGASLGPDSGTVVPYQRRLTDVQVIQGPTTTINLQTVQTDGLDPNTDDYAIFRVDEGHYSADLGGANLTTGEFAGYEEFTTVNQPLYSTAVGNYQQMFDSDDLGEGYHYVSVIAFRHRSGVIGEDGGDAVHNEWRKVIYIDRQQPTMDIVDSTFNCTTGNGSIRIGEVGARTVTDVWCFIDLADGAPIPPLTLGARALKFDRSEWLFSFAGLNGGEHSVTIVAQERPKIGEIVNQAVVVDSFDLDKDLLRGDVNGDWMVDGEDLYDINDLVSFTCEADVDADLDFDSDDPVALEVMLRDDEVTDTAGP